MSHCPGREGISRSFRRARFERPAAWRLSWLGLTSLPCPTRATPTAGSQGQGSPPATRPGIPEPYPRSPRPGRAPAAEGGSARTRRRPRPWPRSSSEGAQCGHAQPRASAAPLALKGSRSKTGRPRAATSSGSPQIGPELLATHHLPNRCLLLHLAH